MVFDGKPTTDDIIKEYGSKIERQMKGFNSINSGSGSGSGGSSGGTQKFSQSYERFRESMMPSFTRYERWAKTLGSIFTMKVGEKDTKKIGRAIDIAHLNVTVSEAVVFAAVALLLTLFGGVLLLMGIWFLTGAFSVMVLVLVFFLGIFLFYYVAGIPERLAMIWRLKASAQMVPAILYIVIYMKHTSNFEKAIAFAAEHLDEPLALDFKKIFWDVEVGRFSTIKDSVDSYLETWRDYSIEFIEAFHLVESSLYEPGEERRVATLEKALQVILDGVYDKMLKYTHDVKSPLTNLYMLGIVLPTLGLAILPLASTMLQGAIKWWHVLILFNLVIPFAVFFLTQKVMMQRPGGYGETSLLERNPLYPKYASKRPYLIASLIMFPMFLVGLIPLLWRYTDLPLWLNLQRDYSWSSLGLGFLGNGGVFGIMQTSEGLVGPFGALSLVLSLFIPLSVALMFSMAYSMKTKELIGEREKYKQLEQEFNSSLFQLGNRIGDGTPAEIAFARVSDSTKGTATEGFFRLVNENIQQLGMSLDRALFDKRRGAVIFYPSSLVATSMKILVESVKKGLKVAARSLMSISDYVKNIKKINDRLNDLLADIVSDMKSNMTFLAPLLAGIIIGLAGMITTILGSLSALFESGLGSGEAGASALGGAGGLQGILSIFDITKMIPTYWLQVIIGIYLIEIVFILTGTLVTIKSGRDNLQETAEIGKNLKSSIVLYFVVALGAIIGLSLIGAIALAGLG